MPKGFYTSQYIKELMNKKSKEEIIKTGLAKMKTRIKIVQEYLKTKKNTA